MFFGFEVSIMRILSCSLAVLLMLACCEGGPTFLGGGVDIFSLLSQVSTYHSSDSLTSWFYRNNFPAIFSSPMLTKRSKHFPSPDDSLKVVLCENIEDLYEAYFSGVQIEDISRKQSVQGWSPSVSVNKFGLKPEFFGGGNSYLLVRMRHHVHQPSVAAGLSLSSEYANALEKLIPGHFPSAYALIKAFGSHFVSGYSLGDSLYQVFVYNEANYSLLKQKLGSGIKLNELQDILSPLYAKFVGPILSSSGVVKSSWLEEKLVADNLFYHFPSLLQVATKPLVMDQIKSKLSKNSLVTLNLRSLASFIKDKEKQKWLHEVINNKLNLYQLNL